jgi:hypothetical protein
VLMATATSMVVCSLLVVILGKTSKSEPIAGAPIGSLYSFRRYIQP